MNQDNKVWTLADEEQISNVRKQLAELEAARNRSYSETGEKLVKFLNNACHAHQYDYRGIAHLINCHRWELVEILTEGRYSSMIAILAVSQTDE